MEETNVPALEVTDEATIESETKPTKPDVAQPEMFEIKVNGRTTKVDRAELIRRAQMSDSAHEKYNEAAQLNKKAQAIIDNAKSNPMKALMDPELGLSKLQIQTALEEWYHENVIQEETLSPEQKRLRDAESKLKKYELDEQSRNDKEENEQREKLTNQEKEYLQNQIVQALDGSGLPKTKFIAGRVAFYMRENLLNGWDAPVEMIIDQVKKERQSLMSDITDASDPETLIALLGEGVVNKIRKYDLEQLRAKRGTPPPTLNPTHSNKPAERLDMRDVDARLRAMRDGTLKY